MEQKYISFEYQARYFQLGEINQDTRQIVFVLHGYGQQAQYFIRKFAGLNAPEICVIAPEGLSRFYLEGFGGRVGATWMTREDRLTDIHNYISYLNTLYTSIAGMRSDLDISVIGFSQGAATASRWVADGKVPFNKLILWAGIFPPDMEVQQAAQSLREKQVYYVYGKQDPFLSDEKLSEMKELSQALQVTPVTITFEGGHDIDSSTLQQLFT